MLLPNDQLKYTCLEQNIVLSGLSILLWWATRNIIRILIPTVKFISSADRLSNNQWMNPQSNTFPIGF